MPAPGSEPRKRGDRWEIRWRELGGRRRSATFETRRGAAAALRRLEEKAEAGRYAHLAPNAFGGDLGRMGGMAPTATAGVIPMDADALG